MAEYIQENERHIKVENDTRYVLMAYTQPTDTQLSLPNGNFYNFHQYYCSCAWVLESDVDAVLSHMKECCGGRRRHMFNIATPGQFDIWVKRP